MSSHDIIGIVVLTSLTNVVLLCVVLKVADLLEKRNETQQWPEKAKWEAALKKQRQARMRR